MADLNYFRQGSGPPLLLIHGIGSRWQIWLPVLEALSAERDVIAVDLPGFGFSPKPPAGTRPGPTTLSRLIGEFIDELGIGRPHVAGNSLGGWVALELARQGRVASVTALSPAGFHNYGEGIFLHESLRTGRIAARAVRSMAAQVCATPRSRKLAFFQMAMRGDRIPAFDAAENLRALADAPWFEETLEALVRERFYAGTSLGVPVTIAWGEHDRLLLHRQGARAANEIPDARMITLTGCGHVPTYDDPEQVSGVLLEGSASGD